MFYTLYTTRARGTKLYGSYLIMLLTSVVLYATNQRTAWISFGLCLVLLAITKTQMKKVARFFIAAVAVGFFGGFTTHFSFWENSTLFSKRQETVNYRRVNDLTTLAMGRANPIFGIGFGNFKSQWRQYFQPIEGTGIRDLEDGNHNTFLGLFAEVGLAGLIPFLMLFYYMFGAGLRVYRKGETLEQGFALVFLLVVIIYIFGANVGDYRSGPFFNTVLLLLFGTVAGIEAHMALPAYRLRSESVGGAVRIGRTTLTAGVGYRPWGAAARSRDVRAPSFGGFPKR
jgi:O-antigen ligase